MVKSKASITTAGGKGGGGREGEGGGRVREEGGEGVRREEERRGH